MLIYAKDTCFTASAHMLFMLIWTRLRFIKNAKNDRGCFDIKSQYLISGRIS